MNDFVQIDGTIRPIFTDTCLISSVPLFLIKYWRMWLIYTYLACHWSNWTTEAFPQEACPTCLCHEEGGKIHNFCEKLDPQIIKKQNKKTQQCGNKEVGFLSKLSNQVKKWRRGTEQPGVFCGELLQVE